MRDWKEKIKSLPCNGEDLKLGNEGFHCNLKLDGTVDWDKIPIYLESEVDEKVVTISQAFVNLLGKIPSRDEVLDILCSRDRYKIQSLYELLNQISGKIYVAQKQLNEEKKVEDSKILPTPNSMYPSMRFSNPKTYEVNICNMCLKKRDNECPYEMVKSIENIPGLKFCVDQLLAKEKEKNEEENKNEKEKIITIKKVN